MSKMRWKFLTDFDKKSFHEEMALTFSFFPHEWGENCRSRVIKIPSNNDALGIRNSLTKCLIPLTNRLVSLVNLELPSKIQSHDINQKKRLGAIG